MSDKPGMHSWFQYHYQFLCLDPISVKRIRSPASFVHSQKAQVTRPKLYSIDYQVLTKVSQDILAPQSLPFSLPITLTTCTSPCASTTCRQHYFRFRLRVYMRGPFRGQNKVSSQAATLFCKNLILTPPLRSTSARFFPVWFCAAAGAIKLKVT
jgi:hypothetical protein